MKENQLNFLIEESIITETFVQQQYEMLMRKKYLSMDPWSISQGKI